MRRCDCAIPRCALFTSRQNAVSSPSSTLAPGSSSSPLQAGSPIALPFSVPGVKTRVLYEEPFSVVVPQGHPWESKKSVKPTDLADENLLVLNNGHCFRDQVLEACPGQPNAVVGLTKNG